MPSSTPPIRRLIVLGSTGSIGENTLAVVDHLRHIGAFEFEVVGLAAGSRTEALLEQCRKFKVPHAAMADARGSERQHPGLKVFTGPDAALRLVEEIARPGDLVVGAMVGSAGLPATLAAIERGCDIALANKETLVAAGELVVPRAQAKNVRVLPIDSEHSAIFQCLLSGRCVDEVKRLVITASGGPFRNVPLEEMKRATVEAALDHPTWKMGPKVTVDSASMMNKALEIIEAHWLFGLPAQRIEVIVHPQSIVHSFVEFIDHSVVAQLGPPDMRTPIQYALTWPHRLAGISRSLDWKAFRHLEFEPLDSARFAAPSLACKVIERGGTAGAIFNAANEVAVAAFLDRRIDFGAIIESVSAAIDEFTPRPVGSLADVMQADREAREWMRHRLKVASRPKHQPALAP